MLKALQINNYALISELEIIFDSGFTVITGETGAGKSIILGALSLILGNRADTKNIKPDTEKCIVEAHFDISTYQGINHFFELHELDFDSGICIIRREITNSGKSRAFINDTPVTVNVLRDLSTQLIDIHSQHENLLLTSESFQLDVVDTVANNYEQLSRYKIAFNELNQLRTELKELNQLAERQTAEQDYLQFQYQQLTEANLTENEQDELETESQILSHAEEIKSALEKSFSLFDDEKMSLQLIRELISIVSNLKKYIPQAEIWTERLQTAFIDLKDLSVDINNYNQTIDYNPQRLAWVNNRLNEIYTLQKKFKTDTVDGLIQIRTNLEKNLKTIDSFAEQIEILNKNITIATDKLQSEANLLTKTRINACKPIELHLIEIMKMLGIPNVKFEVRIKSKEDFTENGIDEIQFFFTANKNRELQSIQQVASGGEISRIMLSIKSLIANKSNLPTIIFDEIDTGVSGETAQRMGEIMQNMSRKMQVITITHLAQIAAKGKQHFKVYKDESGRRAETFMKQLNADERIIEIAQMISGAKISNAALINAGELLDNRTIQN